MTGTTHFSFSPHRVNHRPVQRVGEQLRLRCGNLFYQTLDVFTFLLGVGPLYAGEPGPVHPEALVVVVIQGHQLPLARLFVGLFVIKLVEDAVHRQLLPLPCVGLTGASCGTWRGRGALWIQFSFTDAAGITCLLVLQWLNPNQILSRYWQKWKEIE